MELEDLPIKGENGSEANVLDSNDMFTPMSEEEKMALKELYSVEKNSEISVETETIEENESETLVAESGDTDVPNKTAEEGSETQEAGFEGKSLDGALGGVNNMQDVIDVVRDEYFAAEFQTNGMSAEHLVNLLADASGTDEIASVSRDILRGMGPKIAAVAAVAERFMPPLAEAGTETSSEDSAEEIVTKQEEGTEYKQEVKAETESVYFESETIEENEPEYEAVKEDVIEVDEALLDRAKDVAADLVARYIAYEKGEAEPGNAAAMKEGREELKNIVQEVIMASGKDMRLNLIKLVDRVSYLPNSSWNPELWKSPLLQAAPRELSEYIGMTTDQREAEIKRLKNGE